MLNPAARLLRKPICGQLLHYSIQDHASWITTIITTKFLNGLLKELYKGASHSEDITEIPLFPAQFKNPQFVEKTEATVSF